MRAPAFIVAATVSVFTTACGTGLRKPANTTPGAPNVTWVLMYGDQDNPDQEFSCQSGPGDCVLPASRPGERVFSDLHLYYHGIGVDTRYEGTKTIGYLQVSGTYTTPTAITVRKDQSITNESVTGIVTPTAGSYSVVLSLTATKAGTSSGVPLQQTIKVTVR